jgi:hypothetical protein
VVEEDSDLGSGGHHAVAVTVCLGRFGLKSRKRDMAAPAEGDDGRVFDVPAVHRRPVGLSVNDRADLAAVVDCCARLRRAQLNLLADLRQQRAISEQAYTGLLARGDQLDAAVAELAVRYSPARPRWRGRARRGPDGG